MSMPLPGTAYVLLVLSWGSGIPLLMALLTSDRMRVANRFLSIALGSILYCQTIATLTITKELVRMPVLYGSGYPFLILSAPALYFYARALTEADFRVRSRQLGHLLAPAMGLFWYLSVHNLISETVFEQMLHSTPNSLPRVVVACVPFAFYLALTLSVVFKYERKLTDCLSSIESVRLQWLKLLSLYFLLILLILIVDNLVFRQIRLLEEAFFIVTLGFVALGIFATRQSAVLSETPERKPEKSGALSEETLLCIKTRMWEYLNSSKAYLNPNLRLVDLANAIDVKSYEASETINRAFGKNFYDLINELRVEEVKKRLLNPDYNHLNILGVATDCGFNSKSSFNDAFKRITGLTPSQFKASAS